MFKLFSSKIPFITLSVLLSSCCFMGQEQKCPQGTSHGLFPSPASNEKSVLLVVAFALPSERERAFLVVHAVWNLGKEARGKQKSEG